MKEIIYRKDYSPSSYLIEHVDLVVDIYKTHTLVTAKLKLYQQEGQTDVNSLFLNGVALDLQDLKINDEDFSSYRVESDGLILENIPSQFLLTTVVKIGPENNFSCEGLYRAQHMYCTQCEAQGFRKITYFLDRPDIMSIYKVQISADKNEFPYLLSNGNLLDKKELENNRHQWTWEDPFLKPSYLFALVAGDFDVLSDSYKTMDKRDVLLEIYVDKGQVDKAHFAMESLKRSMKWDEDRFQLSYDLDRYMIVATESFNMGAMENKGLNIFNSKYVFADERTATDADFINVEAVIGHEYFHNWTGNRVTCRDWFQLTLKEGLTVFREQEFTSDLHDRAVKRIEDVLTLKQQQFPEDQGPLSHPIRPESYSEINNFYTATVYEKGAEVIRMLHTMIGESKFQQGMKIYFDNFDGKAVTTDDFIWSMQEASGEDLSSFAKWYASSGTPVLKISLDWNQEKEEAYITINQTQAKTQNEALSMPFKYALYSDEGELVKQDLIQLTKKKEEFTISNLTQRVLPSWNQNFTAPVKIEYEQSRLDKMILIGKDKDLYNRFNLMQELLTDAVIKIYLSPNEKVSEDLSKNFITLLSDSKTSMAFRAYAAKVPSIGQIADFLTEVDFKKLQVARRTVVHQLAFSARTAIEKQMSGLCKIPNLLDDNFMQMRSFKGMLLYYLGALNDKRWNDDILFLIKNAPNMTEQYNALIATSFNEENFEMAMSLFYKQWSHESLVMQKWISLWTQSTHSASFDRLKQVESDRVYMPKVPNYIYSSANTFGRLNLERFHDASGQGYDYLIDRIKEVDKFNPQVAARLMKNFSSVRKISSDQRKSCLTKLKALNTHPLSADVKEVLGHILTSN